MAIISFYSLKIIFGHFTRCNWTCLLSMVFVVFFGGKWYKNGLFGATTHKNIDFTALNAGIRWEKNIYFWNHLYHHDHDGRLIPASYVVPKINEYLILRNIYFFAPKSLLMCIPNVVESVVVLVSPETTEEDVSATVLIWWMSPPSSAPQLPPPPLSSETCSFAKGEISWMVEEEEPRTFNPYS